MEKSMDKYETILQTVQHSNGDIREILVRMESRNEYRHGYSESTIQSELRKNRRPN